MFLGGKAVLRVACSNQKRTPYPQLYGGIKNLLGTHWLIPTFRNLYSLHLADKTLELSHHFVEQKEDLISLHSLAASIFHPQHEVMTELANWLVPVLCRPRANAPKEFSLSELALKKDLCKNAIQLLDCVNPGINRKRGIQSPSGLGVVVYIAISNFLFWCYLL